MTILTLQRRLAEVGRIRLGKTVPTDSGKTRPAKLDTFRLTSQDQTRIAAAAELWGGDVAEWTAPAGQQWEVITNTDSLDVLIPPAAMAFSQHYEMWSAGGCQRRCDGVTESITEQPCLCDPDDRECAIHTRLSVMLRDLPGLGVWRVDTSGYYAAVELGGAVEIINMAARGAVVPARLRLEQRQTKRPNQGTRRFAVPVLDLDVTPGALVASVNQETGEIEPPCLLTPVPEALPAAPVASIAEQAQTFHEPKRRSQTPIPETGIEPRTVDVSASDPSDVEQQLDNTLDEIPKSSDTVPVWEAYLRQLFRLMQMAGHDHWGDDGLHAGLQKRGFAHVADMKKAELMEFTTQAVKVAMGREM